MEIDFLPFENFTLRREDSEHEIFSILPSSDLLKNQKKSSEMICQERKMTQEGDNGGQGNSCGS